MSDREAQARDTVLREAGPRRRSSAVLVILAVCALLAFAGFIALGTWQVYRLQWKVALIERVEHRVHAPPVPAPGPARWPAVTAEADEYRHVSLSGSYLHSLSTLVQATTELGSGYWVVTPLRVSDAVAGATYVVLVNRGYVSADAASRMRAALRPENAAGDSALSAAASGTVTVTGLLRMTEPGGGYLRQNDPSANRWYSRDVQAIAAARGLSGVAPYFVDADAANPPAPGADAPVGGLTVVAFHNNHLVYALTWYALALMVASAAWWVARDARRTQHGAGARGSSAD
jgi:surfeit locus 1 family protein